MTQKIKTQKIVKDEKRKGKMQLIDLKNVLPVPVEDKENQEFTFKSWTMKEEKKIAKMKSSRTTMGEFVSNVFGLMLDTLCGENFQDKKEEEKIHILNQFDLPNIIYMWIYLRYDVLGPEIVMDVGCPNCGKLNEKRIFTLDTMDVTVKKDDVKRVSDYKLHKIIKFNEEIVESLRIRITRWDSMESAKNEVAANEGLMKELIFNSSIIGINDSEGAIPELNKVIENLTKRDIEGLSAFISKHNGGPTLTLEDDCTSCSNKYFKFLNWSYEDFFGQSSLPEK